MISSLLHEFVLTIAALVTRHHPTFKPASSLSNAECDHNTQTPSTFKPPPSLPNTEKSDQGEQATPETGWTTSEQEAGLY